VDYATFARPPADCVMTKIDAVAAFDAFVETWGVNYDEAVECLIKDLRRCSPSTTSPAEHWKHLRTTNIIESSFATVCRRTVGSKGCLSNTTALPFKLAEAESWQNQLPKIILGIKFIDLSGRKPAGGRGHSR